MPTPPRHFPFLAGGAILLSGLLSAQITPLGIRPIDADYSAALDRIIMISTGPNQLNIYNPLTNTNQAMALSKAPLSLSLSPSGVYAAVGHEQLISYVNLSTMSVEKTFPVTYTVNKLALSATYIFVPPYSIHIATGSSSGGSGQTPTNYEKLRVDPGGAFLFGTIGSSIQAYSLAFGTLGEVRHYGAECADTHFSEDGARLYTRCSVFQMPPVSNTLGIYRGTFGSTSSGIRAVDESTASHRLAVLEPATTTQPRDTVLLLETQYLQPVGRFVLPEFTAASLTYPASGRWIFFSPGGSSLYVIMQAASSSGLLLDFAIATLSFTPPPVPCTVTLSKNSLTSPGSGTVASLEITNMSDCVYQASSSAPWIQLDSGGYGSGRNTLTATIRRNTGASRAGTITIGDQTVNVSQGAADVLSTIARLTYPVGAWNYSRALDRMVLLGLNAAELLIVDPAANLEQAVSLPLPGSSLSLSPDGRFAVIGHDGWISYVDLGKPKLEATWEAHERYPKPVLPGNGYVYWGPATSSSRLSYVHLSTGTITRGQANTNSSPLFAHPGGRYLYALSNLKWDTSVTPPDWNPINTYLGNCSAIWFAESGNRLYTSCGGVFRSSEGPDDLQTNGSFPVSIGINWATNSTLRQSTAVIPIAPSCCSPIYYEDTEVQVYADDGLLLKDRYSLPSFVGDAATYVSHGRGVFWNSASDRLYALVEADSSANLISDNAIVTITPGTTATCSVSLTPSSASYGPGGGSGQITLVTDQNCVWNATPDSSNFISVSNRSGVGSAVINYSVSSTSGTAARSGFINVSGQTFAVSQAGLNTAYVSTPATFTALGGTGTVFVTAPTNYPWTAVSDVPWILITQGTSGSGSNSVSFSVSPNAGSRRTGTMTIAGETVTLIQNGVTTQGMSFKPITPCRLMETRPEYNFQGRTGTFGPPFMNAGETRTLQVAQSTTCNIPDTAKALVLNVTLVPNSLVDFATVWQSGISRPSTWTVRSTTGSIVANSAIVQLGTNGGINVYTSNATNILIDVSGYFTNDPNDSNLVYYPMNPCRVVDTRAEYRPEPGPFGPPSLSAQTPRRFRFPESPHCAIPSNAAAYSVTLTVVPPEPLVFLTAWPAGGSPPNVSSINSPHRRILANSVIVPAGEDGAIDVYAYARTDLLVDINGYFAPDDGIKGLYYFPVAQCRVLDTSNPIFGNLFGPPPIPSETSRTIPIRTSSCGFAVPSTVKGYAINMTALPNRSPVPFITAWATGEPRPNASQLNAFEGLVVTNSAIVPSGTDGSIDVFAYRETHLVVELSGYFGR